MYWEIIVEGNVQGVGFRQSAKNLAKTYQVVGFAENVPDGHVHIEAAGDEEALLKFYEALQLMPQSKGAATTMNIIQRDKEFEGFDIR